MAIPFARARIVGRRSGGNVVRTAAYNERTILVDRRGMGHNFNFQNKSYDPILHHEVLIPDGASAAFKNPDRLWNAVEAIERRKDSQLAKEVVLSLPTDDGVGLDDWRAMARQFAHEQFVSKGLAAQIDIHPGPINPHAHILVTMRRIEGDRLAEKKARDLNPAFRLGRNGRRFVSEGQRIGFDWGAFQDRYFRAHGFNLRVDPVGAVPQLRVGLKRRPGAAERVARNEEIKLENARAAMDPEKVIAALTRTKATFTEREVSRFLTKAGLDKPQVAEMRDKVMGHNSLIPLYDPATGELAERYTTKDIRAQELRVMQLAREVSGHRHGAVKIAAPEWMREDQKRAHDHALSEGGLKVIEGRAGVGKSKVLAAVREGLEAAGYRVVGVGPTNVVASDMRTREGFQEARTAHSWLFRIKNDMDRWSRRTAVIADEAAMQSAGISEQLLSEANKAGARVILVGDDRQLGSIERGALFTEIAREHGAVEITEVVRQHAQWQRQAAMDLAAGRFGAAVEALDAHGAISWSDSLDAAMSRLVGAWAQDRLADPDKTRFAFAWTNADVAILNREMRQVRIDRKELGPETDLRTKHGTAPFSVNDRVQFTGTAKLLGIFNGEAATITRMRGGLIEARTDNGRQVTWNPHDFDAFRHGYAGTIYRSQGQTLDATYVLHTGHWRAPASYVGLTRQRDDIKLFVSTNVAANQRELADQMGKPEQRSSSLRWESDREEAVRKSVELGRIMQDQEKAERLTQAKTPTDNSVELIARGVVAGLIDYEVLVDTAYQEVMKQPDVKDIEQREIDRRMDNMIDWALNKAEERETILREARTPEEWAAMIERGHSTYEDAMNALNGDKKVPLEQWQANSRALMDAIHARKARVEKLYPSQAASRRASHG